MDRTDKQALGISAIGHVVLFAILSLSWNAAKLPPPANQPIDVSLVDNVALEQTAPPAAEPPVVHVHVGRIDVRAPAPPAPPAESRLREPRMSLDDYLEGRRPR